MRFDYNLEQMPYYIRYLAGALNFVVCLLFTYNPI